VPALGDFAIEPPGGAAAKTGDAEPKERRKDRRQTDLVGVARIETMIETVLRHWLSPASI